MPAHKKPRLFITTELTKDLAERLAKFTRKNVIRNKSMILRLALDAYLPKEEA